MPSHLRPSEAVFRLLRNAHGALQTQGYSYAEADAFLREGYAAFFAEMASEGCDPERERARLIAAIDRHFENLNLGRAARPRTDAHANFEAPTLLSAS